MRSSESMYSAFSPSQVDTRGRDFSSLLVFFCALSQFAETIASASIPFLLVRSLNSSHFP